MIAVEENRHLLPLSRGVVVNGERNDVGHVVHVVRGIEMIRLVVGLIGGGEGLEVLADGAQSLVVGNEVGVIHDILPVDLVDFG